MYRKEKRRRKQRPLKGASAESVFRTNMGNIIHGQAGFAIIIKGTLLYSCCPGTLLDGSFGQQWGLAGHSCIFTAGISQRVPHKYRLLYLRIIYTLRDLYFLKRRGLISMLTLAQLFLCHPLIVSAVMFFFFVVIFRLRNVHRRTRAVFSWRLSHSLLRGE